MNENANPNEVPNANAGASTGAGAGAHPKPDAVRMIIDADTGIDDAMAILYALKHPGIRVEGITTVFGNIPVERATDNSLRIVRLANAPYEVPVHPGASAPLVREPTGFAAEVHGTNGIGNVELPASEAKAQAEPAADFLIRKANELEGRLTLCALGRLTNVADALVRDPSLAGKLERIYVMGGAVRVPGNVTPVAEANIWGDPEAADIVFRSGAPITMVGLDVTMKTLLRQTDLDLLLRLCKPENRDIARFLNDSMRFYFDFYRESNSFFACAPLHDPLTVLAAVEPGVLRTEEMRIAVECESRLCAGMTVADLRRRPQAGSPVQVAADVDAELAVAKLLNVFL